MERKTLRVFIWILIILYFFLFLIFYSWGKIIFGILILVLVLISDLLGKKEVKRKKSYKAAQESLYDAIKFIAFGIFAIIYPFLGELNYLLFILFFVIILFIINLIKEKAMR